VKRLLVATRNAGKLIELRALLGDPTAVSGLTLETLDLHPEVGELEESGETFEANARAKAVAAARASAMFALGEDSGLEVDALGGAPGVRSARYAGGHGDDAANLAKLLRELATASDRRARFVCVAALADPAGRVVAQARGTCEGAIALAPRGAHGFGYDPVFVPAARPDRTMAEFSRDEKSALSHRGAALRAILPQLRAALC
jgi:XTP/dITP diphosphohydrolase